MEPEWKLPFEQRSVIPVDPRTKIILTLTVSTIMVSGGTGGVMNIVRPVLAAIPVLMLALSQKWNAVARFGITYLILFMLELIMLPELTGSMNFLAGAMIGIYTHMLPGFIMGYYLISTTTVSEFVAAMEKVGMPQQVVIPVSVVFRFFPTLQEEYSSIQNAMRMRGITAVRNPLQMLEYRVVPLMISVAKIGEELSAAAITRGLGAKRKRTNICEIGFRCFDVLLLLISGVCWAGFLIG